MKSIILVAFALVAVAVAAPAVEVVYEPVKITESKFVQEPEGSYNYDFKSEDGISRQETGVVKEYLDAENKPQKVIIVRGSYTYYTEEGKPVTVTYYADETGFHAESDVIPKIILVAVALVAVASAIPVDEPEKIVRSSYDQSPEGAYNFLFETEKGINRAETGELKTVTDAENKPQTVVVVRGSYSYTDSEGKVETINYEADEDGYRAQGASIPVAPVARR
ncbi:unnamed protein product [Chrysodeixis includens]|uniref:Uncharacterized protein n=1 Tax=Chrysodeixis includens TaxID=689277 RepID=A0A9N8KTV7_CHRIL|nr:unnamed protein product [Chrysodeixis includens]